VIDTLPERAIGRMARRSISAASFASNSTDGRVTGRRGGSGAAPSADLIACSCDAIDAIGYNSSRWRWQREGGSCLPPPLNPKSCAVGEAAAAAAGEGRGGGERETMEWKLSILWW
jgi:hypothetical protein